MCACMLGWSCVCAQLTCEIWIRKSSQEGSLISVVMGLLLLLNYPEPPLYFEGAGTAFDKLPVGAILILIHINIKSLYIIFVVFVYSCQITTLTKYVSVLLKIVLISSFYDRLKSSHSCLFLKFLCVITFCDFSTPEHTYPYGFAKCNSLAWLSSFPSFSYSYSPPSPLAHKRHSSSSN